MLVWAIGVCAGELGRPSNGTWFRHAFLRWIFFLLIFVFFPGSRLGTRAWRRILTLTRTDYVKKTMVQVCTTVTVAGHEICREAKRVTITSSHPSQVTLMLLIFFFFSGFGSPLAQAFIPPNKFPTPPRSLNNIFSLFKASNPAQPLHPNAPIC